MSLIAGGRLGPYEILAPLGAGGMGEVWRARDSRLGRDVAIKALPAAFAQDAERLARFEREAKLLATLSHPHIAGIHGLEVENGARYLVLEFVAGETLAQRLSRGPLPLDETLALARQVATALEAAHESGIVHRDLKPGNIMLTETADAKVLDFGLAKGGVSGGTGSDPHLSASPTMTYAATHAGVVLGTAAYMSPEQARGKKVDRRADIWSFGCVLFECLTGRQAFEGETVSDLVARILEREPDWSLLPAGTPPRLRDLLRRCLRKDPRERLRDIGDAHLELTEIAAGGAVEAAAPVAARKGPSVLLQIAAAVLAAVAGVVATKLVSREAPPLPLHVSVQGPEGARLTEEVPDLTVSPDGSTLAFTATDSAGVAHLWLRVLASDKPRMLPGTEGAGIPFWSPDSRHVAFFADGSLKRIAVSGEGTQTLCAAPNPRGGAWGAGDVIVFAPTASGPLMTVPATGGTLSSATTLDSSRGETAHRFPSFLPGGRRFLYVALPGKDNLIETRIGIVGGRPGPAVATANSAAVYARPGYLIFVRQGTVYAQRVDRRSLAPRGPARALRDLEDVTGSYSGSPGVSASNDGILVQRALTPNNERVEVLDRLGNRIRTLPLPPGTYSNGCVSRDGRHIAFEYRKTGAPLAPIVLADLERGTSTRLAFDGPYNTTPIWSPDGRRVIYGSDRTGGRKLYWRRTDGSGGEEFLADAPSLFNDPNDVTPDGKFVVFRSLSGQSGEDLWIVPLDGDHHPKPLIQTRANEIDAAISPDGRWIAYRSDESGEFEIYVQSFPSLDRKHRVSVDGATGLLYTRMSTTSWRADGRELYFIGRDGRTVMAAPVGAGPGFEAGVPRPQLKLPRDAVDLAISPDGQRFYVSLVNQTVGRGVIQLVMNWQTEMERSK